jgi:hypothetical protein
MSCDTGKLKVIADLPIDLNEASGIEIDKNNSILWMINDSGNKPILYGLDRNGDILKEIRINAKNRDWEDLASDSYGNLYIGNFGNNDNDSKNLSILKIHGDSLKANLKSITPDIISFSYPEQTKFPPKKSKRHFDCESFFFYKDSLYLFTKSRDSENYGKTNLYQLPAKKGDYSAKYLASFNICDTNNCWVTSADINERGDQVILLTEDSVFLFSEFRNFNFLDVTPKRFLFNHSSQKESIVFKNDSTLYITDEYLGIEGGNLYEFNLN